MNTDFWRGKSCRPLFGVQTQAPFLFLRVLCGYRSIRVIRGEFFGGRSPPITLGAFSRYSATVLVNRGEIAFPIRYRSATDRYRRYSYKNLTADKH
jgi:hypothetical protein